MKTPKNQQGFSVLVLIVSLVVIAGLIFGGYYVWGKNKDEDDSKKNTTSQNSSKNDEEGPKDEEPDPYEGWESYENATYGISFRYPADWKVEDGPVNSTDSATRQQYAVILELSEEFKYNETLNIEILDQNLDITTEWYDNYYAQSSLNEITKTVNELKGKKSVQYSVVNSGEESKLYLFSVDDKTYLFSSLGTTQLDPDYWAKFNKIFTSFKII
jgi:hypothetical protein